MSINKLAIIRYEGLNRCFSNKGRKFFLENLLNYVSNAIQECKGKETSISRGRIFKDIDFMRNTIGFEAPTVALLIELQGICKKNQT